MSFMKKGLIIFFLIIMCISLTYAGKTVGTSSAIFLKKAIGARAAALGEAYTSIGNDPDAIFFNPASLGLQEKPELSAMYQTGLADISFGSLIYAHSFGIRGTPAFGMVYSDAGSIDVNVTGQTRKYKKAQQDSAYYIGYGVRFFDMLSLGFTGKYISSTLVEDYDDSTIAFDVGLLFQTPLKGLQFGASALNRGKGLSYIAEEDPLPRTYRGGISYTYSYVTQEENLYKFLVSGDGYKTHDEKTQGGAGIEMTRNFFALRIGYLFNRDIEGFTTGIGLHWSRYSLDYAFGLVDDLAHNHRVSFHVHFSPVDTSVEFKRKLYQHRPKTLRAQ